MSQKEVQVDKKWYWELEQKNETQVFIEQPLAFFSDDNIAYYKGKLICCFKNGVLGASPFMDDVGNAYAYCALLSSEHEKKSRRGTNKEIMKWCLKFGGFWIDDSKHVRLDIPNCRMDHLTDSIPGFVVSICTWDGEPMEPTAQNMGLPE